tara:strand:- start:53 stop:580 length:528 start_codon:yes stop_codon:yes gene_type:complete
MSYNNQPEWETYKPTIKEELYECEVCDTKRETITKSYGALDMELCKDCWDGEYDCGCSSFIPYSYIMWGRNEEGEEEEVEICRRCSDDWEEKGWVNSMDYKDYEEYERKTKKKKKKKFKIVIKKSSSAIEEIDDLMGKLSERFLEKIDSVNMSKEEKDVIDYLSGKKNARSRKRR